MATRKIFSYTNQMSVKPGEIVEVMVSAEGTPVVEAQLVRLVHADAHPDGPGYLEEEVVHPLNGEHLVGRQYVQLGSHAVADSSAGLIDGTEPFTVTAFIWPTLPGSGRQVFVGDFDVSSNRGWALGLSPAGHVEFWHGNGSDTDHVTSEIPVVGGVWYQVTATFEPRRRRVTLHQHAIITSSNSVVSPSVPIDLDSVVVERTRWSVRPSGRPVLLAGAWDENPDRGRHVRWLYNGKLDRPAVVAGAEPMELMEQMRRGTTPPGVLAFWDTSVGYSASGAPVDIADTGPGGHMARTVNMPVRGMTGWNWSGSTECYLTAPDEYGGVLFADSSVTDCGWSPTFEFEVPDVRSGYYAVRMRSGEAEEYAPFFVRARQPTAKIAFQVPTASYLAYANEHLAFDGQVAQSITAHTPVLAPNDVEMYRNPQFGLSTYDHHSDHLSGVCYSGWRRPILNMRPKHRAAAIGCTWQFPADLSIVAWLDQLGVDYEVITDHDVHEEGAELLNNYNVVLTGTHPEYYSAEMLAATEGFMAGGGRFMYMGGNGLYWVTSFVGDGDVIEVRKLEGGTRAWQARPGEYHHMADGARGGIWKNRGRGPHKVTGVGFASEGMDRSGWYRRSPASWEPDAAWIFDGTDGECFGDFGLAHGGAAGLEIDRYDRRFGTPGHTRLLASSEGHSDGYPLVAEELLVNVSGQTGTASPLVRADVTYTTTDSGGAAFCTGSIAWGQALPANGFDNDIARITENVLRRFAADGPLELASGQLEDQQDRLVEEWRRRQDACVAELCSEQLLAELENQPFGPHSDVAIRVLNHLRNGPASGRLIVVEEEPHSRYLLVDMAEGASEEFDSAESAVASFLMKRIFRLGGG